MQLLVPTRSLQPRITDLFAQENRKIEELTQQQFKILNILRYQKSTAIIGGAGTGTTLRAIEKAEQLAEMERRVGVILQKGGLADAKTFTYKEGLKWFSAGSEKCEKALKAWKGERAQAGMLPPNGFPKWKKFSGV